jgi:hypothetical protein
MRMGMSWIGAALYSAARRNLDGLGDRSGLGVGVRAAAP